MVQKLVVKITQIQRERFQDWLRYHVAQKIDLTESKQKRKQKMDKEEHQTFLEQNSVYVSNNLSTLFSLSLYSFDFSSFSELAGIFPTILISRRKNYIYKKGTSNCYFEEKVIKNCKIFGKEIVVITYSEVSMKSLELLLMWRVTKVKIDWEDHLHI